MSSNTKEKLSFPTYTPLDGEDPKNYVLNLKGGVGATDSVALLMQQSPGQSSKVPDLFLVPTSLELTDRTLFLGPVGRERGIVMPLISIDSFKIAAASRSLHKLYFSRFIRDHHGDDGGNNNNNNNNDNNKTSFDQYKDSTLYVVTIFSKLLWDFRFVVQSKAIIDVLKTHLKLYPESIRSVQQLPALLSYRSREKSEIETVHHLLRGDTSLDDEEVMRQAIETLQFGWNLYSVEEELQRQLKGNDKLLDRFHVVDQHPTGGVGYGFSPTLPWRLVQPAEVSKEDLKRITPAREEGRVPVVTYVHRTGAVLGRSGQPLSSNDLSVMDAKLCFYYINPFSREVPHYAGGTAATSSSAPSPSPPTRSFQQKSLYSDNDDEDDRKELTSEETANTEIPPDTITTLDRGKLHIADCRPIASAKANRLRNGGYERPPLYSFCSINFYEIDNVFGVSASYKKLKQLLHSVDGVGSLSTSTIYGVIEYSLKWSANPEVTFWRELCETKWMHFTHRVLTCAIDVAARLHRGQSCLVHCTSGWDRTPQCTAAAQLLVDPFYRTVIGFCILLEKDFSAFGHRLAERNGMQVPVRLSFDNNGSHSKTINAVHADDGDGETLNESPIVLQFMDIVYQILRQSPESFEFTSDLLLFIAESVYSGSWGTWLCNSAQERELEGVRGGSASVWTEIIQQTEKEKRGELPLRWVNPYYDHVTAWEAISSTEPSDKALLQVNCSMKRIVFWEALYLRYDSERFLPGYHGVPPALRPSPPQKVTYGGAFDEYLREILRQSLHRRAAELPELLRQEEAIQDYLASKGKAPRGGTSRSKCCHLEVENQCEGCLKQFNAWKEALYLSDKQMCPHCKLFFCKRCIDPSVHGCQRRGGKGPS